MIIQDIEAIPEGITIMVISQNEAPATFARLHANNRMYLLGWNEIKFTVKETKEIAYMKAQKRLPDRAIRELHAKTGGVGGWPHTHDGKHKNKRYWLPITQWPYKQKNL